MGIQNSMIMFVGYYKARNKIQMILKNQFYSEIRRIGSFSEIIFVNYGYENEIESRVYQQSETKLMSKRFNVQIRWNDHKAKGWIVI
jgi:hypothetical protein